MAPTEALMWDPWSLGVLETLTGASARFVSDAYALVKTCYYGILKGEGPKGDDEVIQESPMLPSIPQGSPRFARVLESSPRWSPPPP